MLLNLLFCCNFFIMIIEDNPIPDIHELLDMSSEFISIPRSDSDLQSESISSKNNKVVKWSDWYTKEQIEKNPNILFLFGDNDSAKYRINKSNPGGGGQTSASRPIGNGKLPFDRLSNDGGLNGNAIGITTTFYDGYTPNIDEFKILMDKEFEPIEVWVKEGGTAVIPYDDKDNHNLGTGIANLKNKIPGSIEYIQFKIDNLVKLGQQPIQDPQGKSFNTLKQELHKALLAECNLYHSEKGFQGYLVSIQRNGMKEKK